MFLILPILMFVQLNAGCDFIAKSRICFPKINCEDVINGANYLSFSFGSSILLPGFLQ